MSHVLQLWLQSTTRAEKRRLAAALDLPVVALHRSSALIGGWAALQVRGACAPDLPRSARWAWQPALLFILVLMGGWAGIEGVLRHHVALVEQEVSARLSSPLALEGDAALPFFAAVHVAVVTGWARVAQAALIAPTALACLWGSIPGVVAALLVGAAAMVLKTLGFARDLPRPFDQLGVGHDLEAFIAAIGLSLALAGLLRFAVAQAMAGTYGAALIVLNSLTRAPDGPRVATAAEAPDAWIRIFREAAQAHGEQWLAGKVEERRFLGRAAR